jgi:hypothetical protein
MLQCPQEKFKRMEDIQLSSIPNSQENIFQGMAAAESEFILNNELY